MPLFTYECKNEQCKAKQERFVKQDYEGVIICKKCGKECQKNVGLFKSKTQLSAKEMFVEKTEPEIERIRNDISAGKDKAFLDIYGEN